MRTAAIDRQIAVELEQLAEAQEAARKAADLLAQDPSNPKHRIAVVQAQHAVAEVQIGIDALNAARVEGEKADTDEADEAYRAETLSMFNRAKALVGKRVAAGKAIDIALQGLHDALCTWKQLNDDASAAANGLHRRLYGNHNANLLNMDGDVVNALVDQISEAVGLIPSGHHLFTLNKHTRHVAGVPESVEKDAEKSSTRYLEILEGMARAKGVV